MAPCPLTLPEPSLPQAPLWASIGGGHEGDLGPCGCPRISGQNGPWQEGARGRHVIVIPFTDSPGEHQAETAWGAQDPAVPVIAGDQALPETAVEDEHLDSEEASAAALQGTLALAATRVPPAIMLPTSRRCTEMQPHGLGRA